MGFQSDLSLFFLDLSWSFSLSDHSSLLLAFVAPDLPLSAHDGGAAPTLNDRSSSRSVFRRVRAHSIRGLRTLTHFTASSRSSHTWERECMKREEEQPNNSRTTHTSKPKVRAATARRSLPCQDNTVCRRFWAMVVFVLWVREIGRRWVSCFLFWKWKDGRERCICTVSRKIKWKKERK